MSKLQQAKRYAYSIRHDGLSAPEITRLTAKRFGLDARESKAVHQYVLQRVACVCDSTLCGQAGLLALRLPLNRIAEVFS